MVSKGEIGNYIRLDDEIIGSGTYGMVYRAKWKGQAGKSRGQRELFPSEDDVYAIKEIDKSKASPKEKQRIEREVKFLKEVHEYKHRNIISYKDSFEIGSKVYIVMELCEGGTLHDYIREKTSKMEEEEFIHLLHQIAHGLAYLHSKGIMHRDLKPKNILLTGTEPTVKIADFGVARETDCEVDKLSKRPGSYLYMSPEIIRGESYSEKTDIWTLGCTCCELVTGKYAVNCKTKEEVERFVGSTSPSVGQNNLCHDMNRLIQSMMDMDPARRPSVNNIVKMLANHRCENVLRQKYKPSPSVPSDSGISSGHIEKTRSRHSSYRSEASENSTLPGHFDLRRPLPSKYSDESESLLDSRSDASSTTNDAKRRLEFYKMQSKDMQRRIINELDYYEATDDLVAIKSCFKNRTMEEVKTQAKSRLGNKKYFRVEHILRALKELEDGIRETKQLIGDEPRRTSRSGLSMTM